MLFPLEYQDIKYFKYTRSSTTTSTNNVPKGIKFIPPPIPLRIPEKKVLEHGQYMNVMLRMNPADDQSSKYKKTIPFFKDGTPEEYVQWTKHFNSVTCKD
jgi:hypothetical protein